MFKKLISPFFFYNFGQKQSQSLSGGKSPHVAEITSHHDGDHRRCWRVRLRPGCRSTESPTTEERPTGPGHMMRCRCEQHMAGEVPGGGERAPPRTGSSRAGRARTPRNSVTNAAVRVHSGGFHVRHAARSDQYGRRQQTRHDNVLARRVRSRRRSFCDRDRIKRDMRWGVSMWTTVRVSAKMGRSSRLGT